MRPVSQKVGVLAQPLDTLLGTSARVRLLRVLLGHAELLTPAQLAQRARISQPAVAHALVPLVESGLVERLPGGRSGLYRSDRAHPFAAPLVTLFDAERARRDAVVRAAEVWAVRARPKPRALWLFGSVARASEKLASDLDLAVVAGTKVERERVAGRLHDAIAPVAARHAVTVNVMPYDLAEIRDLPAGDPAMWANLRRDALPLADSPTPDALLRTLSLAPARRRATGRRARAV